MTPVNNDAGSFPRITSEHRKTGEERKKKKKKVKGTALPFPNRHTVYLPWKKNNHRMETSLIGEALNLSLSSEIGAFLSLYPLFIFFILMATAL